MVDGDSFCVFHPVSGDRSFNNIPPFVANDDLEDIDATSSPESELSVTSPVVSSTARFLKVCLTENQPPDLARLKDKLRLQLITPQKHHARTDFLDDIESWMSSASHDDSIIVLYGVCTASLASESLPSQKRWPNVQLSAISLALASFSQEMRTTGRQ